VISAVRHLFNLARGGYVFAREGVLGLVDPAPLPAPARLMLKVARLAERPSGYGASVKLAAALTRLGPTYVKLGQFLATRADVVGPAIARDLEQLQDKMAPFPQAEAEAAVAAALMKPLAEIYTRFGPPVAAASIAQVHKAEVLTLSTLPRDNGDPESHGKEELGPRFLGDERERVERQTVAVKVLRPGVERRLKADLDTLYFAARNAERFSAEARRLRLVEVVDTLARSVAIEMDLRLEAAAIAEMRDNVKDDPDFRVPGLDWDRTARTVLTLEWIDGTPMSDRAGLAKRDLDLPALGRALMQTFLRHALRDGFFHADMHPGNLFVDAEGRIVAVDFGIMGRLTPKERRFLAEILYGFITRDYIRTAQVHFEAGYVPPHHSVESFAQAIRAIGEPIHNRPAAEISMAKLLTLLFEVTGLFDMKTRPELLLLQKTMVVVEGVARSFDQNLDMWKTAEPVVREWIERHLGAAGVLEQATTGVSEVGRFIGTVPALLGRASTIADQLDAATREGLVLAPETVAAIGQAEAHRNRWTAAALWVIAALLVVVIWKMV
jgi:ubiquinone biosynthesis protein